MNDEMTPRAYTVTLTWAVKVTVIALSEEDAVDTACAEMSVSDAVDQPDVDAGHDFDIADLSGPDVVLVADLSDAGIDEEDHPGETEGAWGEWARMRSGETPMKERLKAARRVLGDDAAVSDGQLARQRDTATLTMFEGKAKAR